MVDPLDTDGGQGAAAPGVVAGQAPVSPDPVIEQGDPNTQTGGGLNIPGFDKPENWAELTDQDKEAAIASHYDQSARAQVEANNELIRDGKMLQRLSTDTEFRKAAIRGLGWAEEAPVQPAAPEPVAKAPELPEDFSMRTPGEQQTIINEIADHRVQAAIKPLEDRFAAGEATLKQQGLKAELNALRPDYPEIDDQEFLYELDAYYANGYRLDDACLLIRTKRKARQLGQPVAAVAGINQQQAPIPPPTTVSTAQTVEVPDGSTPSYEGKSSAQIAKEMLKGNPELEKAWNSLKSQS